MFVIASCGICSNVLLMCILGQHGHGHSHGGHGHSHGHGHAHGGGTQDQNINMRAAYLHTLGDLVQSIGVMIAGVSIWIGSDKYGEGRFQLADPICTFLFAILVIFTTKGVFMEILGMIMMKTPDAVDMGSVGQALLRIDGVIGVHDLHCFSISDSLTVAIAHLEILNLDDQENVLISAHKVCIKQGIVHSTFQIETSESKSLLACRCASQGDEYEVQRRDSSAPPMII